MKVSLTERAIAALASAPAAVKYDESQDRWQARVNDDWRFYFTIEGDTYLIRDIVPHPK